MAVADDGRVEPPPLYVLRTLGPHVVDAPADKGVSAGIPPRRDHAPADPGLNHLKAHHLEQRVVVPGACPDAPIVVAGVFVRPGRLRKGCACLLKPLGSAPGTPTKFPSLTRAAKRGGGRPLPLIRPDA